MSKKRKKNHSNKIQQNTPKAVKTDATTPEKSEEKNSVESSEKSSAELILEEAVYSAEESLKGLGYEAEAEDLSKGAPSEEAPASESLESVSIGISERKAGLLSEISMELNGEETFHEAEAYSGDESIPSEEAAVYEGEEASYDSEDDLLFIDHDELHGIQDTSGKSDSAKDKSRHKKSTRRRQSGGFLPAAFKEWIAANRRFAIGIAAAFGAVLLFLIVLALVLNTRRKAAEEEGSVSVDMVLSSPDGGESMVAVPADPLLETEDEALYELMLAYFKAREEDDIEAYKALRSYTDSLEEAKLQSKSEFIEDYRNLKLYTKPGPYENSYMVYVSYDLKLKEFEQTVPAVETLVVCEKESEGDERGELYVYSGSFDESVVDYIKAVTAQEDVVDLFRRVDAEYKEIMDGDPDYAEYMSSLKQLIRDGVSERLAAAATGQTIEEDTLTPTEAPVEDEEAVEESVENKEFEVEVTDYVNVRASDSENADRVGNVGPGTKLTCKEQLANGWSRVVYEGNDAYIKSDYLVVVNSGDSEVIGKITVKETVNIRSRADKESQALGSAYAGTSYDLLEKDKDGWTKILYNGKEAYVKTEYVEEE